jgi:hypothetical protein
MLTQRFVYRARGRPQLQCRPLRPRVASRDLVRWCQCRRQWFGIADVRDRCKPSGRRGIAEQQGTERRTERTHGRWSALDGRRLYAHARTASFLYQAVLRAELTRRVGLEWAPVTRGIAEAIGVPWKVARAFSCRRADIEAALH